MRQAVARRGALDRPADQRRGRPGVLMLGIPRADGEGARAKDALAEFDISSVQVEPPSWRAAPAPRARGFAPRRRLRRKPIRRRLMVSATRSSIVAVLCLSSRMPIEPVFSAIARAGLVAARRVPPCRRRAGRGARGRPHDRPRRRDRTLGLGRLRRERRGRATGPSIRSTGGAAASSTGWRAISARSALFPFGGPPHFPFQQWARRAEPVHPSPIGLLIHPIYGLWHSLPRRARLRRGARRPGDRGDAEPVRLLPRAPVPQRLSGRRVCRRRLRRPRLRGAI